MTLRNPHHLAPLWAASSGTQTCQVRRVVLAVVHSVAAGERVLAAAQAVEDEAGVQVVFTQPPGPADNRVADFLAAADALTTPWDRAAHERFDLVIAASPTSVRSLRGALLLLPDVSAEGEIVDHNGRHFVPALNGLLRQRPHLAETVVVGLPHDSAVVALQAALPEAARHAVVLGDPVYDQLLAAHAQRDVHREQLGLRRNQRMCLIVSTRGPDSLLGRSPSLLERIATDLRSSDDRLLCHLHPDVWVQHGRRQVLAWAGPTARARVGFLRLGDGWSPLVAAADYVVGDHGALTAYAAAIGKPVYLANPMSSTAAGSLSEAVARYGTLLDPAVPLSAQLNRTHRPSATVACRVTSAPGRSAGLIRAHCRRLLRLTDSIRHVIDDY